MDSSTDRNSIMGSSSRSAETRLCAGGCGFFGTAKNHGLCSKCFKDSLEAKMTNLSEAAAVTAEQTLPSDYSCKIKIHMESDSCSNSATANTKREDVDAEATKPSSVRSGKNRCTLCNKKVGVLGFVCRCGGTFCGTHRYPEAHSCRIDFKKAGKIVIEMENPVCKADKMKDRI